MAGTSSYPGALDDFAESSPTNLGDDDSTGRTHSERHDDLEAAMEAVQGELGTDPAGPSASTVAARFTALDSSVSGKASASVTITAGNGLSGGGDLSADRTLSASFATDAPLVNGSASAGVSNAVSRGDHVHPTDTSRAPLASPTFTGTPAAPTASVDTDTTQIATTAYVVGQGYLKSASAASVYAPLASPSLTGTPTAPTASVGTNTTQVATTEFVNSEISNDAVLKSVATASAQVLVGAASSSVVALAPGSAGQVLTISSSATYGLAWTTPTGGGGMSLLDSQTFTSSTTYSVPTDAKVIVVECVGAGGGGGGGGRQTSTTQVGGGGGGGGGGYWRETYTGAEISGSVTVTVGAGGTGGTGRTGSTGSGTAGGRGGVSRFGPAYWPGGGGGQGGGTSSAEQGRPGNFLIGGVDSGFIPGNGAVGNPGAAGAQNGLRAWRAGAGGGSGGNVVTAGNERAGGTGGLSSTDAADIAPSTTAYVGGQTSGGGAGGSAGGGNGTAGTGSSGGGGGGGSKTTAGGTGAAGGTPGGGGGGGGGANADFDGGNGGAGGNAQIKVWIYG